MLESMAAAPAAPKSGTLVVLQPGYLPWLGFFDQLRRCDLFVYYDDVQFDKNGWRNRNRVKSPDGPHWLTVPVLLSGHGLPRIVEVEIDRRMAWPSKHIGTIRQFYSRAPYARRYLHELEELLSRDWRLLVELDIAVVELMCSWLGLSRTMVRSSELDIGGDRSERLLNICRRFGARTYLSGSAARDYLDVSAFDRAGIHVQWQDYEHPVYPQLHGDFVPQLSTLDLILNCGDDSAGILGITEQG